MTAPAHSSLPLVHAPQTPLEAEISHEFMRKQAPELAKDIVLGIGAAKELAVGFYGLTEPQWDVLRQWPAFRALIAQANEELAGAVGMTERIRRQARYALATGGIADMAARMSNPSTAAQHVVRAGEALAEIGGVTSKTVSAGGGVSSSGPLVHITFADGRSVEVGVNKPAIEGEAKRVENNDGP